MNSIIADQKIAKRRGPPAVARRGSAVSGLPSRPLPAWEFRSGPGLKGTRPAQSLSQPTERRARPARRRAMRLSPLKAAAALFAHVGAAAAGLVAELGRRAEERRARARPRRDPVRAAEPTAAPRPDAGEPSNAPAGGGGLPEALRRILASGRHAAPQRVAALAGAAACLALLAAAAFRGPSFPMPEGELLPEDASTIDAILAYVNPEPVLAEGEGAVLPEAPATLEYQSYTVKKGDTLLSIANRHGRSLDTLIAINGIGSASSIRSGAVMRIPNMDGLVHQVKAGESLGSISAKYKANATSILDANDLGSAVIRPGQSLFIPGARLPEAELRRVLGVKLDWPLRGPISSYYGYRANPFTGVRQFHGGLDIVVDVGTPVKAAMDGRVADVGYNSNFGNYVIVSHVDGLQTLYAHLSARSVSAGNRVQRGAVLGLSGNTGYSTGPHLHFGVYRQGISQNPNKFLN